MFGVSQGLSCLLEIKLLVPLFYFQLVFLPNYISCKDNFTLLMHLINLCKWYEIFASPENLISSLILRMAAGLLHFHFCPLGTTSFHRTLLNKFSGDLPFPLASLFRKQNHTSSRLGALSTFNSSNCLIICSDAIMKPLSQACFQGCTYCCISWIYSSLLCHKITENISLMKASGCYIVIFF